MSLARKASSVLVALAFLALVVRTASSGEGVELTSGEEAVEEFKGALANGQSCFAELDTYVAVISFEERHGKRIRGTETVRCIYRKRPFGLYFRWFDGGLYDGLQASYMPRRDGPDHFTALESGIRGIIGTRRWSVNNRFINGLYPHHFKLNRYYAGFLLGHIQSAFEEARAKRTLNVAVEGFSDDLIPGQKVNVYRLEFSDDPADGLPYRRMVIGIDNETSLPFYMATYDFDGRLHARYRITSFEPNARIDDSIFDLGK